ncbi:hypothetical protein DEJ47_20085 [Streptomyces venezuelae]|uniref:Uncharacterized protein n=1 Tax=Streptomyces venezuelae TaxID=54571 RepID=A0A5P2BFC2_STRVZ|nr:hypothetical protein DEJ47_20085 [Streptomyces venezuelae]
MSGTYPVQSSRGQHSVQIPLTSSTEVSGSSQNGQIITARVTRARALARVRCAALGSASRGAVGCGSGSVTLASPDW